MKKTFVSLLITLTSSIHLIAGEPTDILSFYKLTPDERVEFQVNGGFFAHTGLVIFDVEIYSDPQPRAVLRLSINSAMQIEAAEKAWGHHINESVEKLLTTADIKYLEDYLLYIRSQSISERVWTMRDPDKSLYAQTPVEKRAWSGCDFDLKKKALEAKELIDGKPWWRWDLEVRDYFFLPKSDAIEQRNHDLVRTFVGFTP